MPKQPVARLTKPAEIVAALPMYLGYVPTESVVVACLHEPRGRLGLTMRFDLPAAEHGELLVREISRRVRHQGATRVLIGIYTGEADDDERAGRWLFELLREALDGLLITEAVLVRQGRFWSYLCDRQECCPAEGTAVADGERASAVQLIAAEQAFSGRAVLQDRDALEASLAGPTFLKARAAMQRCESATIALADTIEGQSLEIARSGSRRLWAAAVQDFTDPPGSLDDEQAAALAISLVDVVLRDELASSGSPDCSSVVAVLEELVRRTPTPYDAPVCALFGWMTYCEGGGAEVSIVLTRALASDPDYTLAHLLAHALDAQLPPKRLRAMTRGLGVSDRRAS
jgi:hypothetical protein